MKMAGVEAWRGERLYWDVASEEDRQLHLARYQFRARLIRSALAMLDAACGSGYGAAFLADKVRSVDGVDVDPGAVDFAKATYQKSNLTYHSLTSNRRFRLPMGRSTRSPRLKRWNM